MLREMSVFAMHWHKKARPDQVQDKLQFFLAGVTMHMHWSYLIIIDFSPLLKKPIYSAVDQRLVTGDWGS